MKPIKITREGQLCRKCGMPVIKQEHNEPSKHPYQTYWFRFWFYCPDCHSFYMVEKAKVYTDKKKVRLIAGRMCYLAEGADGLRRRSGWFLADKNYVDEYDFAAVREWAAHLPLTG